MEKNQFYFSIALQTWYTRRLTMNRGPEAQKRSGEGGGVLRNIKDLPSVENRTPDRRALKPVTKMAEEQKQ